MFYHRLGTSLLVIRTRHFDYIAHGGRVVSRSGGGAYGQWHLDRVRTDEMRRRGHNSGRRAVVIVLIGVTRLCRTIN